MKTRYLALILARCSALLPWLPAIPARVHKR